jgi:formylglycine-generating enzyme required for sulfatase activity
VHGNVWEWCEDVWHENYKGAPTDGSAWLHGADARYRVYRGGSWNCTSGILRVASRWGFTVSDNRGFDYGFRLARTL